MHNQEMKMTTDTSKKKATKSKKSTAKVVAERKDDALDIPANLRVENRPVQEAAAPDQTTTQTPVKAKPVKVAKPEKGPSLSSALRSIVVKEPKISTDELFTRLEGMGFKGRAKVTVATLQSDCLQTLKAAVDAGLFPKF
jgi:hypothetical protein